MHGPLSYPVVQYSKARRQNNSWMLFFGVFVFWGMVCAVLIALIPHTQTFPFFATPDDAMRLVGIRDILAAPSFWQAWFDTTQVRLNPPEGVVLHWSRLVDLLVLILISGFQLIFETQTAEYLAGIVWPLLLLFGVFWINTQLVIRFVGDQSWSAIWAGLILPVLFLPLLFEFRPGRLDHHNIQILLTLALVYSVLQSLHKPAFAIIAGLIAALMIAIGVETLAFICVAFAIFGLRWVWNCPGASEQLVRFGVCFATFATVLFVLTTPMHRYSHASCDVLSPVYITTSWMVAFASLMMLFLGHLLAARQARFFTAVGFGLGVLGGVAFLFPQCLHGPYSQVEPLLNTLWMAHIEEAKGFLYSLQTAPHNFVIYYSVPLVGWGLCLIALYWSYTNPVEDRFWDWALIFLFLSVACLIALLQLRGAKFAGVLAVPVGAWVIAQTIASLKNSQNFILRAGRVAGSWMLFAGLCHLVLFESFATPDMKSYEAEKANRKSVLFQCLSESEMRQLNRLPAALLLAPQNLGAHILLETHHSVLAAPYHRNAQGLLDTIRAFNAPQQVAYDFLKKREIAYIVLCPGQDLMRKDGHVAEDALARVFARGDMPNWLETIAFQHGRSVLKVFRVK